MNLLPGTPFTCQVTTCDVARSASFNRLLSNDQLLQMTLLGHPRNSQLIPWITLLAIGFYIGGSAQMVLGGRISLGALVTTINIYKDRQNARGRGHALKKKQLISESKEKNWREELPSPKITSAAVLACPDFFKRPAISQAVDVCCWRPEHNSGIV